MNGTTNPFEDSFIFLQYKMVPSKFCHNAKSPVKIDND